MATSSSTMSLSGMAGCGGGPAHVMMAASDPMAQSMPAGMMSQQLATTTADSSAIEALNKTCSSLQSQVESLQQSLTGVMQFMSAFSSFELQQDEAAAASSHKR